MSVISLKDVDPVLYKALKQAALDADRTFRDECLRRLARALPDGFIPIEVSSVPLKSLRAQPALSETLSKLGTAVTTAGKIDHDPEICQEYGCRKCKKIRQC